MMMEYELLQRPDYILAGKRKFPGAFQGLRTVGPYNISDCPIAPRILFVYPKEIKEAARRLYLSLRDGIGPFKGTESLFHFTMPASGVILLDSFSTQGLDTQSAAKKYETAILAWINDNQDKADLALILHDKTDAHNDSNPYLSAKFPLLKANIPSQIVTTDTLSKPDLFQWSAATIALAMFAKMGGQPWAIDSKLPNDSIIVGVNRAIVRTSNPEKPKRYYGFASTFSHHGVYLGTTLFPPAESRTDYLNGLHQAINDALIDWKNNAGGSVNLIVHVRKEMLKEETDIITGCLKSAGGNLVRSYAVLKLVESDHILVANPEDKDAMLPPPAILLRLAGWRGILQISGNDPSQHSFGKTVTHPWHITQLAASEHAPSFEELCNHVLALSAVNWRGLNSDSSPVSIRYPQLVAELLGRFNEAGFNVADLSELEVMRRPWFL